MLREIKCLRKEVVMMRKSQSGNRTTILDGPVTTTPTAPKVIVKPKPIPVQKVLSPTKRPRVEYRKKELDYSPKSADPEDVTKGPKSNALASNCIVKYRFPLSLEKLDKIEEQWSTNADLRKQFVRFGFHSTKFNVY